MVSLLYVLGLHSSQIALHYAFVVKGSLRYNRPTTNLVATWHVVVTSPTSGAQSTIQVTIDPVITHTLLTSTVIHLVARYSHCLPHHLQLTPGKHTVLSPTLCGASCVRHLRWFRPKREPLISNSRGSLCNTPAHVWVSHSDPYPRYEPHPLYVWASTGIRAHAAANIWVSRPPALNPPRRKSTLAVRQTESDPALTTLLPPFYFWVAPCPPWTSTQPTPG